MIRTYNYRIWAYIGNKLGKSKSIVSLILAIFGLKVKILVKNCLNLKNPLIILLSQQLRSVRPFDNFLFSNKIVKRSKWSEGLRLKSIKNSKLPEYVKKTLN